MLMYTQQSIFFFQAEDGIRDIGVTGVQTCALPICGSWLTTGGEPGPRTTSSADHRGAGPPSGDRGGLLVGLHRGGPLQIGRASCRGRVSISVVAVSYTKTIITHTRTVPAYSYHILA